MTITSSNLERRKKRMRRGESFGRTGVDRTLSDSLKSPSRQKQKQQQRLVRFAEETPSIRLCSHYDPNMSPVQVNQRKKELWYSRNDFEEFLRDRISSIRLLKVVEGDAAALRKHCPDLCLRGLEPYQCDTLNQELQCQRQLHLRDVLREQTLHKGKPNPETIRELAQARSKYAQQRARQLGSMDELEVQRDGNPKNLKTAVRRLSLASAQLGLENLMLGEIQQRHQQQQQRRASLTTGLGLPYSRQRRMPVDMAILKEWNAMFLQDIRQKNGTANLPTNTAPKSLSDKTAESRALLQQRDSLLLQTALGGANATAPLTQGYGGLLQKTSNNTLGYDDLLRKTDATANACTASSANNLFRFSQKRDSLSLVGLRRESYLAAGKQQQKQVAATTPTCSLGTLAAAASAVSAGGPILGSDCFRFAVRRDSLSNLHWN